MRTRRERGSGGEDTTAAAGLRRVVVDLLAERGTGIRWSRWRELTSEVERLSAAGEALEALESLVKRSR